ncbi:MAG: hypothetical protein ACYC6C_14710 [Coriobacteriia bacterium]
MSKRTVCARTAVSLPPDLKRRMDKVTEPVNWSAIAALAFEAKLGEIASRKERKTMDDVVERLRASKRESGSALYKEGHELGSAWAKDYAEANELKNLDRASESPINFNDSEALYMAIQPWNADYREGERDFWETVVGESRLDDVEEPDFLRGLVDGALEVWRAVKDKL